MPISLRTFTIIVLSVYCVLTCYTGYILLQGFGKKVDFHKQEKLFLPEKFERKISVEKNSLKQWSNKSWLFNRQSFKSRLESHTFHQPYQLYNIEIWGKAAIGLYLWEHIIYGTLEKKLNGIWTYGLKRIDNLELKFRTGPGVVPTKVPTYVQNLMLILNGRSPEKVSFAKAWLDILPRFQNLRFVILIILGNEECRNDWLIPYTANNGGLVNITFIVYDSPLVNNVDFYQWPLGVATYRGFPKVDPSKLYIEKARPYICNFLGSVYPHTSREKFIKVIQSHNLTRFCFIKTRYVWQPSETKSSLDLYLQSLCLSDLTLNPVGMNTECYRIYEAMAFGSVPVVEDVMTSGICGNSKRISAQSPLRLLKTLNAPVIYISDWSELPDLIVQELKLSVEEKIKRRLKIVQWYEIFKLHFRNQLISIIKENVVRR